MIKLGIFNTFIGQLSDMTVPASMSNFSNTINKQKRKKYTKAL